MSIEIPGTIGARRFRTMLVLGVVSMLTACVTAVSTPEPIGDLHGAVGTALYMDAQETALRELLADAAMGVERVRDDIVLRTHGQAAFEPDSAEVNPAFRMLLESLMVILQDYDRTLIEVSGYTDPTGSMVRNMALSLERAEAVAHVLESLGIDAARITARGLGPLHPVADNAEEAGRLLNRRVELVIRPLGRAVQTTTAAH